MKETRKFIDKILTSFLKNFGFTKKGSVWALRKREFLLTIDLQRSQWSDQYYVNVGIQFENLDEKLPKTFRGDITYRIVQTVDGKTKGDFILEAEISLIQDLIKQQVIEPFMALDSKEDVKRVIASNPDRYLLKITGKKALGLE